MEAAKTGKPLPGRAHLVGLAREAMEDFVKAQKQFLDVIVEETSRATGSKRTTIRKVKKSELSKLARQTAASFIDAQERMVEVAGKQMNANVKTVGQTMELLRPLPKTLMDAMVKPTGEHKRDGKPAHRWKKPASGGKKKEAVAA